MKKLCVFFVLGIFLMGCAPITGRVDSYRALPVDAKSFLKRSVYARILFIKNPILNYGESGTAWKVVFCDKQGKKSYFWATEFAVIDKDGNKQILMDRYGNKLLMSLILKDLLKLKESKFALVSHDASHYYQPDGKEIPAYRFNWKKHGTSFTDPSVRVVQAGSPDDHRIQALYTKVMMMPMVRKYGTTLSKEEYKHLSKQDSKFRKFLRELIRLEVPIIFPFDLTAIAVNMGILKAVRLINALGLRADLNHPEYFSGKVTNRQRAEDRALIDHAMKRIEILENHLLKQNSMRGFLR